MRLIPTDSITVESERRFRKEFDGASLHELANSIVEVGLLHPIVLRDDYRLVAGERRLRAIEKLHGEGISFQCDGEAVPLGQIPYIRLSDSDDLIAYEAELAENTVRIGFTWQERAAAIAELYALRKAVNPEETKTSTARVIAAASEGALTEAAAQNQLARANLLYEFRDDPSIQKAKTMFEAYKLLERKLTSQLTAAASAVTTPSPHTLHLGSAEDILPTLPPGSIDCIIADPPYGIEAGRIFGSASQTRHHYDDSPEAALAAVRTIIDGAGRVCRRRAHLWLFADIERFFPIREMLESDGWNVWRVPVIWYKGEGQAHAPVGAFGFVRSYEIIIAATKGQKPYNKLAPDLIQIPPVRNKLHAAQKPVDLYSQLLSRSCLPGDVVLDPYCGSGTIFPAATRAEVTAIGIEVDPDAHTTSKARLKET